MTSTTIFLFVLSAFVLLSNAFTPTKTYEPRMITIAEPRTVTQTERRNKGRSGNRQRDSDPVIPPDQDRNDSPLEWLMDGDAPRGGKIIIFMNMNVSGFRYIICNSGILIN
jgi:hypothetical protein